MIVTMRVCVILVSGNAQISIYIHQLLVVVSTADIDRAI